MIDKPIKIAVVIPCYKVKKHVLEVLKGIGSEVSDIIVVDDACPDNSGDFVKENFKDDRLTVIRHENNLGVGGAVISGYKLAFERNVDIIVKVDGDGQINPALVPAICSPIILGLSDYAKGNRFFSVIDSESMPLIRKLGNVALSFITKFSSGYMNIFDPTNGFTAIHAEVAKLLPLEKISQRYFFESDMLLHLGCLRAVVADVPMRAVYEDEVSNMQISKIAVEFAWKNVKNLWHRIMLNYFLRDFNIGSVQLLLGFPMILWSLCFGTSKWIEKIHSNQFASAGTVMLAGLPMIVGMQLLLGFLSYELYNIPKIPLHKLIPQDSKILVESRVRE
jgi:dolichol-phosphate mannosyltransferase